MANPANATEIEVDGQDGGAMGASDQYQDFPPDQAQEDTRSQLDIEAALSGVIDKLQRMADQQVQAKQAIEQRWLEDLRQFHGRYDVATEKRLADAKKSKLFVNLTRAKVNSWDARLTDLLFPTDDKNWGIKPVPAPHLSQAVRDSIKIAQQAAQDATAAHQAGNPQQGAQIAAQGQSAADAGASIQDEMDAAEKSADLMEQEIDTQLKESDYNIRTREVIRDSVKLGTGVMKGPITNNRLRRAWATQAQIAARGPAPSPFASFKGQSANVAAAQTAAGVTGASPMPANGPVAQPANANTPSNAGGAYDPTQGTAAPDMSSVAGMPAPNDAMAAPASPMGTAQAPQAQPLNLDAQAPGTGWVLDMQPDPAPEFVRVDPWNYFPDMSARTPEEAEFHFERHLWNNKQLRAAVKSTGLDPVNTATLLREGARDPMPPYWAQLREITANSTIVGTEKRFQVWEFSGVLDDEDLQALADATQDQTVMQFVADNPLLEVPVIIWFAQGKLLKFAPYPLDSCESLYSVMNFEADDTSMFGFGVPFLMRDSQAAVNGAWRMMMDNGGLAVGPQIVIDNDMVKPADDDYALRPMKVWLKSTSSLTKQVPDSYKPFESFNVTANQSQLQAIIALARDFADEETSMPQIAAGGMDSSITKTTGGMSMLMNSANVIFRRVVKNFDDCISSPNIRRIYDWNMQFNQREDIKGNYAIDARGSSVLLVKEMQTQTLMSALQNFAAHPVIGPGLKTFSLVRKLFAAQMIRADDAVKSDDQIQAEAAQRELAAQQAAQTQQKGGKTQAELQAEITINQQNNQTKITVAEIEQKTALITLAQQHNMSLDQLQTELQINQNDINHRERMFAAELGASNGGKPLAEFAGPGISVGGETKPT